MIRRMGSDKKAWSEYIKTVDVFVNVKNIKFFILKYQYFLFQEDE